MSAARPARSRRGFTLIEIMVALTLLTTVVTLLYMTLQNAVRGEQMVREGLRRPTIENAILGSILRDLRYIYWDGFSGNGGFVGRNKDMAGTQADAIDFVTARPSRFARAEEGMSDDDRVPSPLTEVGYALRPSSEGDYLELWRREDFFVDADPTRGGRYSLVYDRITKFDLTYYPIPEEASPDGRGAEEWDSRARGQLPYAIVLEMDFDVEDQGDVSEDESQGHVTRIILLKNAYDVEREGAQATGESGDGGR